MRILGLLLLLAGIGLGVLWPWAQINFLGETGQSVEFGHLSYSTPERASLTLDKEQNPVRIRFRATFKVDAKLPPQKIPVKVVITDSEGTLLSGVISFPTQGIQSGPEQPQARGSNSLNFNVLNEGLHTLHISLAPNENDGGIKQVGVKKISATIVSNAPEIRDDFKALSAALALAGFYLLVRSRGRGRNRKKQPAQENPRKWGRGD